MATLTANSSQSNNGLNMNDIPYFTGETHLSWILPNNIHIANLRSNRIITVPLNRIRMVMLLEILPQYIIKDLILVRHTPIIH